MKAAILVKQKEPLVLDEIDLPQELKYGQVLVKLAYSGICGSQLNEIDGEKGEDKFLPHLLGHEGSGIVEECGDGVTIVKPGDHVVLHWRQGLGIQSATPKYKWKDKTVNAGWVTTFNEYAVVSENRITKLSNDFDLKLAPLYGCAITTAYGVVHNDADLKTGESIAIFGSGGVGIALALASKLVSAYPIIAIDIKNKKLEQAKNFGATHTINSLEKNVEKEIFNLLPNGVDVVVDTTGIKQVRELSYELTSKEGRTIYVGVPKLGEKINIDSFPLHFTKRITGSHGGNVNPSYDIPRLIRLQKSGNFSLDEMISHVYPLEQINEAINIVREADNVVRCLIKMDNNI